MTPQEAINIVDNATGMLQLNRTQHVEIATAIQVLRQELNKIQVPIKEKENGEKSE